MNKLSRVIAFAALVALPVVGLSASPAQAKTVSPQQWSTKFCTALSDWLDTIQGSSSDVQRALADTSDLPGAKTTLVDYLSQAVDATGTAIQDVKAAGIPRTTNGAKIQAAVVAGLGKAKTIFEQAESDAEQLPTDDPESFASDATAIGTKITDSGSEVDDAFSKIDNLDKGGALDKVVRKTRACAFLKTSS
jgi:hypothetical protein